MDTEEASIGLVGVGLRGRVGGRVAREAHEHAHAVRPGTAARRYQRILLGAGVVGGPPLLVLAAGGTANTAFLVGALMLCMGSHLFMGHGGHAGHGGVGDHQTER